MVPKPVKEATLYKPLNGAGLSPGRSLDEIRQEALKIYETSEIPSWRRSGFWTTSLRELELDSLQPKHMPADSPLPSIAKEAVADEQLAGLLVQDNATIIHTELNEDLAKQGVILCSLEEAAVKHSDLFGRYFMRRLTHDRHKLEAASTAFWTGGAFLYVPPNVVVEKPFQIIYTVTEAGSAQYAHTLIVGDKGSDFRVREYDLSDNIKGQALHAGAFELYLEDNARCRVAHLHDIGKGEIFDVSTHIVHIGRDAHCTWIPLNLGGHLVQQHLELSTAEHGADSRFRGIYFTEGNEHLDLFAVDLHEVSDTTGDVFWKGAATGESRASYEGLIKINSGAQRSHTYLQNHVVMLSPKAKVDSIPSVLVSADDVSASHGGTVGEIDEDLVFYMTSRGLSRQEAVKVILEGFFEPVVNQLEDERLEGIVRERIGRKLSAAASDVRNYIAQR